MINDQQFVKLTWFGLFLIICLMGCDNSKKDQSSDATQQIQPPVQKRTPRTLKAFQEAITAKKVGVIYGNVLFKGELPTSQKLPVTLNKSVCGHEPKESESLLVSKEGKIQNVVVALLKVPKGLPTQARETPLQLDQKKCVFIPHVLIVPVDVEFEVLNSDRAMHNFHAIGMQQKNKEININQTKTRRRQLPMKFSEPEIVRVVCEVHSWMSAWIVVAKHPYYALSDQAGQFRLENVPEGSYQVKVWHEKLGEQIKEITVEVNRDAVIDFEFSQP